jgi:sec-independent protein translocase protein TatC
MSIPEEIKVFTTSILHWIVILILFSFLFFFCNFEILYVFGHVIYMPFFNNDSFSVQVFNTIRHSLLPSDVELIATNPMSAVISQISMSIMLAFLITLPILLYGLITYINPALLPREKKVVTWSLIPFTLLFFSGCVFSYIFIIPSTFDMLYPFATVMGATALFPIDEFIQYVFSLMFGVGMVFLLPLFMILLSYLRIVKAKFWIKKWKFALLFFLILSAIMTPDGTGVTMIVLFLPLTLLYFAGCYFAKRFSK